MIKSLRNDYRGAASEFPHAERKSKEYLVLFKPKHAAYALAVPMVLMGGAASATSIDITFSNVNGFGFLATPVYSAVHDGNFDAFDEGSAASAGIEQVAEVPVPPFLGSVQDTSGFQSGSQFINGGDLRAGGAGDEIANNLVLERQAIDPDSTARFLPGAGGPIVDGESVTFRLDIGDPTRNRFATLLGMLVHSNDAFFGNDDAMAFEIFDANGNFVANDPFSITAGDIFDAGTEGNAVFGSTLPGQTILDGFAGEGSITSLLDSSGTNGGFASLATLFGGAGNFGLGGFTTAEAASITAGTEFFSVSISQVAPVPLPAAAWMLLAGIGGLTAMGRRKKS